MTFRSSLPIVVLLVLAATTLSGQTTQPRARKPAAAPATRKTLAPADLTCPSPLGIGIKTKLNYCDVLTGRDPAQGIIIRFPPHRGVLTIRFDLHNRHTYSEDEMRSKRGFASYIASIGVLTLDNTLLTRAVVASEFRRADDLLDRVGGGAGPGGVKAVAPLGAEPISVEIPAGVTEVSLLGEKLTMMRADGAPATYAAPGRPIAVISSASVEYTPVPVPPARRKR